MSTSEPVATPQSLDAGTEYVILLATGNNTWGEVGRFSARTTDAAIRLYAAKSQSFIDQQDKPVGVVAIPARSFKPVTVRTKTTTTLHLEEAKS